MDRGPSESSIVEIMIALQDADSNERALVAAFLTEAESQRDDPDRKLLEALAKIADRGAPNEEYIALFHRNAPGNWETTLRAAGQWAAQKRERMQGRKP